MYLYYVSINSTGGLITNPFRFLCIVSACFTETMLTFEFLLFFTLMIRMYLVRLTRCPFTLFMQDSTQYVGNKHQSKRRRRSLGPRSTEGRHFNQSQLVWFKMHAHASLKYESSPRGTNVLYSVVVLTVVTYYPTDCAPCLLLKIYQNNFRGIYSNSRRGFPWNRG